MVPLLEHLHQLARVGVELKRREQVVVALGPVAADVGVQRLVGGFRAGQIGNPALGELLARVRPGADDPVGHLVAARLVASVGGQVLRAVVAAHAVLVQHRLDLALEAESPRGAVERSDFARLTDHGGGRSGQGSHVLAFVATDAGEPLAGHGDRPTPHQLQGLTVLVQRLHGERRVGRHLEAGRTVRHRRARSRESAWRPIRPPCPSSSGRPCVAGQTRSGRGGGS